MQIANKKSEAPVSDPLALGLINWITTTIVVESELFRPIRNYVTLRSQTSGNPRADDWWGFLTLLTQCHLCVGTWVGLAQSLVFGSPWKGVLGWMAGGLLYKALGHLTLELRPQAWFNTNLDADANTRGKAK